MEWSNKKRAMAQLGWTFLGSLLFALGVNLIIMPLKLYNGGFMGVAQLIRTFVVFATMSSDEFKKDKHYPKKTFFYGICLFCFR